MRRPSFSLKGVLALPLASLLAACTVGPNFSKPKLDLPPQFTEKAATPTDIALTDAQLTHWWQSFDDPVLDQLIDQAIAGNIDLQIARQHLLQAREDKVQAEAGDLPTVDFGASYTRARSSTTLTWPPGTGNYHYSQIGFDASWELDIFGETRRATEAATYDVNASIANRRALLVSLLSEVAVDYTTLRAAQARLAIAESNLHTAQAIANYSAQLEAQGIGTTVEALQAKAQVEQTQSTLPALRADVAVMAHAIAVLLGRYPGDLEPMLSQPRPLMATPATIPVSVPADVIANRPDVHGALMDYAAANAEIGVAVADELPHFTIPLTITPQSSAMNTLFSGASMTFIAAIEGTQHLYEGGKLDAKIRQARDNAQAAQLSYKETVLSALQQVEDALVHVQSDREANASLAASVADAQKALDQSTQLYHAGLQDFLTVLTNERTVFASRDALAESDAALVTDYIALYKALGGGWQHVELDPPDVKAMIAQAAAQRRKGGWF
ncbi:efflux transporter outer membrane subunit [Acidisoma silvae]|uniref:Efflux transporter outer membrane subunit n=1 Tax=Acidisoma silvae TaxID=2802396 RepID=A0A963YSQ7_9PROT|nr:efflux transporter outer membrane subunit [Acidisoma silvae]MCB8876024.1 efflux transporter outer membrane subunit [Acidisoma silvae]